MRVKPTYTLPRVPDLGPQVKVPKKSNRSPSLEFLTEKREFEEEQQS
jgi:hypothetical protein